MKYKVIPKDDHLDLGPAIILFAETKKEDAMLDKIQRELMLAHSFNHLETNPRGQLNPDRKISKRVGHALKFWPRWAHSS